MVASLDGAAGFARSGSCRDDGLRPTSLKVVWRTWRMSSSYEPVSANDGHAAISRPIDVGSATATFATKLATLPITSNAHGRKPPGSRPAP